MRPLLALLALTLSGCTCGIALCQVSSDCGPGATCDEANNVCVTDGAGGAGGGSSGTTTLALRMPAPAARPSVGGTDYEDSPAAHRRNEQLFVWLEASRPLTSPTLKFAGLDAQPVAPAACSLACSGNCYCFDVDLARPALPGMRGTFELEAAGVDPDGLPITAAASLPVTRLAWRRALGGGQIRATPAIGADGTLYVGTAGGMSTGTLYAISAAGQERWNKPMGRIEASIALSAPGGAQQLFVGALGNNNSVINAFDAAGGQVGQCLLQKDSELEASPALIPQGAVFYANRTQQLIAFRPGQNPTCITRGTNEDVPYPDSIVASGSSAFFVDDEPSVFRFDLGGSGWQEYTQGSQWPGTPFSTYRNRGLALPSAGKLVGSGVIMMGGTVFQAAVASDFKFDFGFSPPRVTSAAHGPVVAANGVVLAGVSSGIAAVSSLSTQVGLGDRIVNTPALGEGGRLYALAENGALSEWTYADDKPVRSWSASLEAGPMAFEASPALDCARDALGTRQAGRPGILYAAARGGTLHAIIVDARGIDTTAQWPKYQKDPRNSGTLDTPLQEFACP